MTGISIARVERLELTFAPRPWPFAEARRAEIERHFDALRERNPALWNGRILLLSEHSCDAAVFRGKYFEADFASFLAWRDWGCPDATAKNCFGMGALRGADGGFLLGVMAAHTASPGSIYFPAGMVDPTDIAGEMIDLDANVLREVAEETGIKPEDCEAEQGWYSVFAGPRIAQIKILRVGETAAALRSRILAFLARQRTPELVDIRVVRTPSDFDPKMPPFVTTFLSHMWSHSP